MNEFINRFIKSYFREPRPNNTIIFNDYIFNSFDKYTGEHEFGMPSGHAQSIFYSVSFLYLTTKSQPLLFISLFISALTLYQRWKYRNHTIKQLVVGSIIGTIYGIVVYYYTNKYLHRCIS